MNKVYFGDCRDSMRQMAKDGVKVQMCVTSPPYYGLRDYGVGGQIGAEQTPQEFIDNLVEVFACVWDILADDGTLWVNLGDTYSAGGRGAGSEIQSANKGSITGNVLGTWKVEGYRPKNLLGMPWKLAFALQEFGWNLRQDIIWHKPNPMPESVTDRCTKSHEYIFLLSKNQKYYYDYEAIKEPAENAGKVGGSFKGRQGGAEYHAQGGGVGSEAKEYESRNKRLVWTVNTSTFKGAHFATYPEELIEPCILAGSKVGDIVLDPFFGSGTTGQAAQNLGRKWIGCELNKEYKTLQNQRLQQQGLELV